MYCVQPRLSRESNSLTRYTVPSEKYSLRSEPFFWDGEGAPEPETELYASGKRIVARSLGGEYVHKSATFDGTESVVAATWVDFNGGAPWLAVLVAADFLALFAPDGSQVEAALPWRCSRFWPVRLASGSQGLLFERADAENDDDDDGLDDRRAAFADDAGGGVHLELDQETSTLYSLSHALDDIRAVAWHEDAFLRPTDECVVFVSEIAGEAFMLTHSKLRKGHTAWYLRPEPPAGANGDSSLGSVSEAGSPLKSPPMSPCGLQRGASTLLPADDASSGFCDDGRASDKSPGDFSDSPFDSDQADGPPPPPPEVGAHPKALPRLLARHCDAAASGFVSRDARGDHLVVVLLVEPGQARARGASHRLVAMRREALETVSFQIPGVQDAVAVRATDDGAVDMAVLLVDGSLELWRGELKISRLDVQGLDAPRGAPVIALRDALGSRVSLDYGNLEVLRVEVRLVPEASAITAAALDALDAAFVGEPLLALALRAATLAGAAAMRAAWDAALDGDVEWRALGLALQGAWASGTARHDMTSDADAWMALLGSAFHAEYSATHHETMAAVPITKAAAPARCAAADAAAFTAMRRSFAVCGVDAQRYDRGRVINALHVAFEDSKLSTLTWSHVRSFAQLLSDLATDTSKLEHYALTLGLREDQLARTEAAPESTVTDVHRWFLTCIVKGAAPPLDLFDALPEKLAHGALVACARTRALRRFYKTLFVDFESESLKAAEQLVVTMAAERFGLDDLATVPPGVAAPLFDALQQCGAAPPEGWDARAYDLVGRHDLAMLLRDDGSDDGSDDEGDGAGRRRRRGVGGESSAAAAGDASDRAVGDDDDELRDDDGLRSVEAASALRFGDDCRVQEVCRLLRASRPTFFRVDRPPEMSDHDFEHKKQQKLLLHCTRLCLSGRSPPSNAVAALDASTTAADALVIWPQFHNGVAAGLRLQPCDGAGAQPGASGGEVTRTWIAYNKPDHPSSAHGGLLFALGLQRHLGALAMTDIYEYLTLGHDPTTVGVLLGMAASKRGSADSAVSKMLCLHIPALLPQPFAEMEVSAAAQAAAMTGVGLLYCGTAHRLMAEFLLGEIARKAPCDRNRDREAYALSAGIALGMVTLGRGASHAGLGDLRIAQRLHRAIQGGRFDGDDDAAAGPRRAHAKEASNPEQLRCSRVREGEYINTDMTAPGAIIALGLYFLQTNSASAAARLALPDTHVLLDTVRPDLLMLRVIARGLILWDAVEPTREWVLGQLPAVVRQAVDRRLASDARAASGGGGGDGQRRIDWDSVRQAHCNVVAGGCFAVGLRYAGTACARAKETVLVFLREFQAIRNDENAAMRPDRPTLEMCLSAAATALGMVMAGTGDLESLRLLRELRWRVDDGVTYGTHMACHSAIGLLFLGCGRASLDRSQPAIAALVAAFFPRFPKAADDNQYHLQALRHLWVLAVSWRGLEAVDVDSNAVVPVPLEIELRPGADSAPGPGPHVIRAIAPCLLPPLEDVVRVSVASERYYDTTLRWSNSAHRRALRGLRFYVKRRAGHLSYAGDPCALRERLAAQAAPDDMDGEDGAPTAGPAASARVLAPWARPPRSDVGGGGTASADVLAAYTDDPLLLDFARNFCDEDLNVATVWGGGADAALGAPCAVERWCARALYECVARDKPQVLLLYVQLQSAPRPTFNESSVARRALVQTRLRRHAALTLRSSGNAAMAWSLRLTLEYFSASARRPPERRLLRDDFIEAIRVHLDRTLNAPLDGVEPAHAARLRGCTAILRPVLEPDLG